MDNLQKCPVTIITGFLGSGKTTLLQHLIHHAGDKKLAIIVNEFGTLGMDGDILRGCANENCTLENILELANGCICCTVADDFIPTMEQLLSREDKPDHILIETSGLALPKPLLKAFDWPQLRSKITVDGVIALADAEAVAAGRFASDLEAVEAQRLADDSLDHDTPLGEVFEDQLACADIVIVTKMDLVDEETAAKAKKIILEHIHRPISILESHEGKIDPRLILGLGAAAEDDLEARPSHHDGHDDHEHDDFNTLVLEDLPIFSSINDVQTYILSLIQNHQILRAKGYIAIEGKPMRLLVQAVGERIRSQYDGKWQTSPKSQLVIIAESENIRAYQESLA